MTPLVLQGKLAFQKLFKRNRRFSTREITLLVHHSREIEKPEIAVCVSRKKGNAVKRNRLKRITRESVDPFVGEISGRCYMAFLPDNEFDKLNYAERARSIKKLLNEAGLMKNGKL